MSDPLKDPLGTLRGLSEEEWAVAIQSVEFCSNEQLMDALQSPSPANRSRAIIMAFAAWCENAAAQRNPPSPLDVQRRAFATALRVLKEHLTYGR